MVREEIGRIQVQGFPQAAYRSARNWIPIVLVGHLLDERWQRRPELVETSCKLRFDLRSSIARDPRKDCDRWGAFLKRESAPKDSVPSPLPRRKPVLGFWPRRRATRLGTHTATGHEAQGLGLRIPKAWGLESPDNSYTLTPPITLRDVWDS